MRILARTVNVGGGFALSDAWLKLIFNLYWPQTGRQAKYFLTRAAPRPETRRMLFFRSISPALAGWLISFVSFVRIATASAAFDPPALYLTWQRDPTTTMTIHWLTVGEARSGAHFRRPGETAWKTTSGTSHPLPATDRFVHTVELTGLVAGTNYEFCFAPGEKTFQFRTMP